MNKLTDSVTFRCGASVKNRIVMPPMMTLSGEKGGFVSDDTISYYSARSQAAGLLIVEFNYVSENGGPCGNPGYPEQLGIYSDKHLDGIKQIASSLKKDGNKAILQIQHGGRQAVGCHINGKDVVAPSKIDFDFLDYPIRELTQQEISDIIKDFGKATKRAIDAGFDGVEIHGAHHYLIQQFFSSLSNHRTDKWGQSLENRMSFPLAVVREVKRVVKQYAPKNFIVGYRISPEEIHGEDVGYTYHDSLQLVSQIVKEELDYIHISLFDGYNCKPSDSNKTYAQIFKEVLDRDTKLIIIGGIFSEEQAIDAVENYADLIAVGRGTLIDPQFAKKIEEGKGNTIFDKIIPENINYVKWTQGLLEAFSHKNSLGLPPLPNGDSIQHLHTGKFDK